MSQVAGSGEDRVEVGPMASEGGVFDPEEDHCGLEQQWLEEMGQ